METVTCPLCESAAADPIVTTRSFVHPAPGKEHEGFTIVRCHTCGLMYTNPRPSERDISAYYAGYSVHRIPLSVAVDAAPALPEPSGWQRWLGLRDPGLPDLPAGTRALEVGCATGAYLASLACRGWVLTGLEPSPEAAAYARDVRGLDVRCGTIETVAFPAGSFDAAYAWHVVEHFAHPLRTLRAIHRVLKPGGLLCISIPNAGALEARILGRFWAGWDVPLHYCHYTPATISTMLERAGFAVSGVIHQRDVANIVQSLGAVIGNREAFRFLSRPLLDFGEEGPRDARIRTLTKPLALALAVLRQGGRITVVAHRSL